MTNLMHNFFSYVCLFQYSACFEQPNAHHLEGQLYQYDLWYMSLYVGDRVVYRFRWIDFHLNLYTTRSPTYSDIYQRSYWYNWLSWWWALGCSKHVENWNKQIYEKELCVKLVIYKDSNKIHGQQNIKSIFFYVLLTLQFSIFIFCCPCSSVYLCFADSAVQYIYVLLTVQFSIFMFFWQCSSVYLS